MREAMAEQRVAAQSQNRRGQSIRLVGGNQKRRLIVDNHLGCSTDIGGDDRTANGSRFQKHAAKRLLSRAMHEQIDLTQDSADVISIAQPMQSIGQSCVYKLLTNRFLKSDAFRLSRISLADDQKM